MKRVIILGSNDGWEAMYIDGKLIDQGNPLGEGRNVIYLLEKSEEYGFGSRDIFLTFVTDEDEDTLRSVGGFPKNLSDLKGKYGKVRKF